jgi:hypothetical protein
MKSRHLAVVVAGLALVAAQPGRAAAPLFDPDAPIPFSATIPSDVDPGLRSALLAAGELMRAHRLFERQQWAAFVALNWPVGDDGRPQPKLSDPGRPQWSTWTETFQIFKPNGGSPDAWGSATRSLPLDNRIQLPVIDGDIAAPLPALGDVAARHLHGLSSIQPTSVADEVDQAFSFAIFDQAGTPVRYESLVNRVEYDFIVGNSLFHAEGLARYLAEHGQLTFPAGVFAGSPGAIEVKLAWRVLDRERDDFGRFLTQPAYVAVAGDHGPEWALATVGLVGFHIAQKTETSPQWIWSTFEHVDNIAVDRLAEAHNPSGTPIPLKASFNDPDCPWCPVNTTSVSTVDGKARTQVLRLSPIPKETQALNRQMQTALAAAGSKLAFYEMVGTQWPTDPVTKPELGDRFPGAVVNMSGGKPLPVFLANSVMETFAQVGNLPANAQPRSVSNSDRLVFGNGSCMGCHSASPYDFSWIMTKAQAKGRH